MQEAMQYQSYLSPSATSSSTDSSVLQQLVSENALIVFGIRGCCMCHVAKQLLLGLGVNPLVEEVDENEEVAVIDELSLIAGFGDENGCEKVAFPAFFVGGRYFGGLERVMGSHITGELVPILREAGALWL